MSAPPAPVRVVARELYFRSGGERLRFRAWPAVDARATVVLLHDLGEHAGRHARLAVRLRGRGVAVAAYDLRGHGRSGGARGHLERFGQHVDDLDVFLRVLADQGWPRRAFLVGQGLGGLVAAHDLLRGDAAAGAGAVLVSPALRLRFEPGRGRRALARLLARAAPALPLPSDVRPQHLTRDAEAAAELARDPLAHRRTTPRGFLETLEAMSEALRRAPDVRRPLLVLGTLNDALVSPPAMREFVERASSPDKAVRLLSRLYHDLLHEPAVVEEVERWLAERL